MTIKMSPEEVREYRMKFPSKVQDIVRAEMKKEAEAACIATSEAFAACAKAQGLMVIFRCQEVNKAWQDCMKNAHPPGEYERRLRALWDEKEKTFERTNDPEKLRKVMSEGRVEHHKY
mmetsp:Transcript_15086/g.38121  ORF Transcript_15086/g.38121 Transcript_15086/m.38121 type:complete len:118 (-) Transcript_15086:308-661(-)